MMSFRARVRVAHDEDLIVIYYDDIVILYDDNKVCQ